MMAILKDDAPVALGHAGTRVFESRGWEVDLTKRELRANGSAIPIGSRAFEIIETLVLSAGELVTKDDLMRRVWPGLIVEDNTVQVHISAIRKALGPIAGMLKTVSGRGYRLLGDWATRQEACREPTATLSGRGRPAILSSPMFRSRRRPSSAVRPPWSSSAIWSRPTGW